MRRAIVAGTATVSGVILLLGLKPHSGGVLGASQNFTIGSPGAPAPSSTTPGSGAASSGRPASPGRSPTSAPSTPTASPKPGNSGTKQVTGDAVDTPYGPVQLRVVFNGKRITSISVLRYPTGTSRDEQINSYALPQLNQETMTAQSANIDVISGATFTSEGYQQSLQSAIDKAGI